MTAKQMKTYDIIFGLARTNAITDTQNIEKYFLRMLNHDYAIAVDLWEMLLLEFENKLPLNESFSAFYSATLLHHFFEASSPKTTKAVLDIPILSKAIYQYSHKIPSNESEQILVDLLLSTKFEQSKVLLDALAKNTVIVGGFGKSLRSIMEKLFDTSKARNSGNIVISKKLNLYLTTYVNKVKTEEKALLLQRLKELII